MKKRLFPDGFSAPSPETLFRENFGRLSYFAVRYVQDKAMAEDFVQDAFAMYWDRKETISSHPTAIKDFLYTSVKNSCLNHLKRLKVEERYFVLRNEESFEKEKVLEGIIEAEVIANIHSAVATLPESCRKVFIMSYFENLSNSKIAEILNISVNTVRCHKQNGLKTLRSQLNLETFLTLMILITR